MTTHLTSWSKMSFQKKSKATASVGNPSPKSLARSKSSRVTKSEVKVDPDNNNSQESLEQENNSSADSADKKLDVEGESPQSNTNNPDWRQNYSDQQRNRCRGGCSKHFWKAILHVWILTFSRVRTTWTKSSYNYDDDSLKGNITSCLELQLNKHMKHVAISQNSADDSDTDCENQEIKSSLYWGHPAH